MIRLEAAYREIGDAGPGPWVTAPPIPEGADNLSLRDLVRGRRYEVRARRVNDRTGEATGWSPQGVHEVGYALPPALPVTGLRVVCGESLVWHPPYRAEGADPSGLRFRVLHAPGDHRNPGDMVPATDDWPAGAPFDLCLVPKGARTLCVVPVDDEGQEGEAAYVLTDRGPFDDGEPVEGRETALEPTWGAATLTNCTVGSQSARQDAASGAAATSPFYIGRGHDPFYRGTDGASSFYAVSYLEMTIEVPYYSGPLSGDYNLRTDHGVLTTGVTFSPPTGAPVNWRMEYRRNEGRFYVGVGADPFYIGTGPSKFRQGLDGGSPFYGDGGDAFYDGDGEEPFYKVASWRPWPGRLRGTSPSRMDFRLVVPASTRRAIVSNMGIRETLPERAAEARTGGLVPRAGGDGRIASSWLPGGLLPTGERVERGTAYSAATPGPTVVTFGTAFLEPPTVTLTLQNADGDEFVPMLDSVTTTGFRMRFFDAAGAEVYTGRLQWVAQGR